MIKANSHKYSISALCRVLKINRSTYYYEIKARENDAELELLIIKIFKESRNNYGTRKIKNELKKYDKIVSRRRISRIMKKYSLVSKYTVKHYKVHKLKCNEDNIANEVNREFNNRAQKAVVVSDLTYVNINSKWHYVCILIDLFNREIIGYSVGRHKDANLVKKAFLKVKGNLKDIQIFHTDRGSEFKNIVIDDILNTFEIKRSLSMKGCPYDNAVVEATFKIFKTEFIFNNSFKSLEQLELELMDYINWYNKFRLHGSLGYLSPIDYKNTALKKIV